MKKKILTALVAVLSVVCLAFGLSACGGNGNTSSNFTFELTGDSYALTGYNGNDTEIVIPETYNGLPVTAIIGEAFKGCESLTKITVPDSVTSIGYDAFEGCTSLKRVTFKNTSGWKIFRNVDMPYAQDVNVTDAAQNAKLLTDTYYHYYWERY